eukprot:TRINITY_DN143_c0_g1_i5.p4 TRINITY_DN143_c0_g1~~TRINITY_DN143_c0_g1_i5.p4  ORF type:complete len:108 (-),score=9.03 TRINITY_DN143_c0_g1_i5:279-602(-)
MPKQKKTNFGDIQRKLGLMDCLIKKGSNIDERDNEGRTPLHIAGMEGNTPAVAKLIQLGANRSSLDKTYKRAVDLALDGGFYQVQQYLEQFEKSVAFDKIERYRRYL